VGAVQGRSPSHNHDCLPDYHPQHHRRDGAGLAGKNFWFFRYAIDASLRSRDWDGTERYSSALEDYMRPEPLPWADFFVRYGRALAAHGRGSRGQQMTFRLDDLVGEAERLGLGPALGALPQALVPSS
jgi:hypothetical protein